MRRSRQSPYPSAEFARQNLRINRARDIASRYVRNIQNTQSHRKAGSAYLKAQREGDYAKAEAIEDKARNRKVARSTYMGINNG